MNSGAHSGVGYFSWMNWGEILLLQYPSKETSHVIFFMLDRVFHAHKSTDFDIFYIVFTCREVNWTLVVSFL